MGSLSQQNLRKKTLPTYLRYAVLEFAILLTVTACGGGGGAGSSQPPEVSPSISSLHTFSNCDTGHVAVHCDSSRHGYL